MYRKLVILSVFMASHVQARPSNNMQYKDRQDLCGTATVIGRSWI